MTLIDSQTLERLRKEESRAEQEGRHALNVARMLKNHPQYDLAQKKAENLLAKASDLRQKIMKMETP